MTKPLVVTIKPQKDVRSLSQNSTYWMWLAEISSWSGHDKDELHTLFRRKFLTPEQRKILGEDCWVLQSTTALSTAEMASYMDRVYRFAAEFGIQLTLPEEMAA